MLRSYVRASPYGRQPTPNNSPGALNNAPRPPNNPSGPPNNEELTKAAEQQRRTHQVMLRWKAGQVGLNRKRPVRMELLYFANEVKYKWSGAQAHRIYCILYCTHMIWVETRWSANCLSTVCQFAAYRTLSARSPRREECTVCVHNNASNSNRQRNRRIYCIRLFGFDINRHKWSSKSVPSIQTMVWEGQKKGSRHNPPLPECRTTPRECKAHIRAYKPIFKVHKPTNPNDPV